MNIKTALIANIGQVGEAVQTTFFVDVLDENLTELEDGVRLTIPNGENPDIVHELLYDQDFSGDLIGEIIDNLLSAINDLDQFEVVEEDGDGEFRYFQAGNIGNNVTVEAIGDKINITNIMNGRNVVEAGKIKFVVDENDLFKILINDVEVAQMEYDKNDYGNEKSMRRLMDEFHRRAKLSPL